MNRVFDNPRWLARLVAYRITTGSRSTATWSTSGLAIALIRVYRAFPHPSSNTSGADRLNTAGKSSGPSGGSRFTAVRAHSASHRMRPGIGTPNSVSTSPGSDIYGGPLDDARNDFVPTIPPARSERPVRPR